MRWFFGIFVRHFQRNGQGVAKADGLEKMQRLPEINGAGAWQERAEHGRDQRAAPHAMRHDFVEHVAFGEHFIDMRWIDVAGHDGEEFNILVGERAGKACGLANLQLVERAIFNKVHDMPSVFRSRRDLIQDVITCVDKFDIPSQSRRAITGKEHRQIADFFDTDQQMFGGA